MIQVAALTINLSLSSCPQIVEKYLLDVILAPLKRTHCSDEEINASLCQLYNLCVIPSNNTVSLPVATILPVSRILYAIYCSIKVPSFFWNSILLFHNSDLCYIYFFFLSVGYHLLFEIHRERIASEIIIRIR